MTLSEMRIQLSRQVRILLPSLVVRVLTERKPSRP